jgi:hypothetical protein
MLGIKSQKQQAVLDVRIQQVPSRSFSDSTCNNKTDTDKTHRDDNAESKTEKSNDESSPNSLGQLLQHFVRSTRGKEKVSLESLLDTLDSRSHGPMLLVPALISISPIGAIPGMSIATGTMIILIALQMMITTSRPWLPKRIAQFEFSRAKLKTGTRKVRRWVLWIEKVIYHRLDFLTYGAAIIPISIICIVLAASFYPLALIPMGVFLPGLAITLFALGMTARDGILVIVAYCLTVGSGFLVYYFWPF